LHGAAAVNTLSAAPRDSPGVCDTYEKENNGMAKVVKVIELMSQSPESWRNVA
jgi:hypothetical protein